MEVRGQSFIMGKPLKLIITKNMRYLPWKNILICFGFSFVWLYTSLVCDNIFGTKVIILIHGIITIDSIVGLYFFVVYLFYFLWTKHPLSLKGNSMAWKYYCLWRTIIIIFFMRFIIYLWWDLFFLFIWFE